MPFSVSFLSSPPRGRKHTQSYLDGLQIARRIVKCGCEHDDAIERHQFSIMRLASSDVVHHPNHSLAARTYRLPGYFRRMREIHFVFRKSDHLTAPLARNAGVTQDGDRLRHHPESFTCRSGALMSANSDQYTTTVKQQNSVQSVSVVLMLDWYRNIGEVARSPYHSSVNYARIILTPSGCE